MARNTADEILTSLLPEWHKLLQGWSADGSLVAAAQEALMLSGEPQTLRDLVTRLAAGDFTGLPRCAILPQLAGFFSSLLAEQVRLKYESLPQTR